MKRAIRRPLSSISGADPNPSSIQIEAAQASDYDVLLVNGGGL